MDDNKTELGNLVISRKKNEQVLLGHDIAVTVVEIRGDKVRLAFRAPKSLPVHRREVYDAIHGKPSPAAELPKTLADFVKDRKDAAA